MVPSLMLVCLAVFEELRKTDTQIELCFIFQIIGGWYQDFYSLLNSIKEKLASHKLFAIASTLLCVSGWLYDKNLFLPLTPFTFFAESLKGLVIKHNNFGILYQFLLNITVFSKQ